MAKGKIDQTFPGYSALDAAGIHTFAELAKYEDDYTAIPNVGPAGAEKITEALAAMKKGGDADDVAQPSAPDIVASDEAIGQKDAVVEDLVHSGTAEIDPMALKPTGEEQGQPARFCITADTVIDAVAQERDDGKWDVIAGSQVFKRARRVDDRPTVPGEFMLVDRKAAQNANV